MAQFARAYPGWLNADKTPCCYYHFRLALRFEDVRWSRHALLMENAARIAQSVAKDGEGPRDWWIATHEVAAHWRMPKESSDG